MSFDLWVRSSFGKVSSPDRLRRRQAGEPTLLAACMQPLEKRVLLSAANFASQNTIAIADSPVDVVAADLNGDGKTDLATIDYGGKVSILLGNGDGTFQPPTDVSTGLSNGPGHIVEANFNGHPDLVVSNDTNQISVLLGNGDGTFQTPQILTVSSNTGYHVDDEAVGDLNGDGHPDIVTADGNGVISTFLGNAGGTFSAPTPTQVLLGGSGANRIILAPLVSSSSLDAAVINEALDSVSILPGNGQGGFESGTAKTLANAPSSITAADFNNDGHVDLATVGSDGEIDILLNNGDGTFSQGATFSTGITASVIKAGDVNGDGDADLVVTDYNYSGTNQRFYDSMVQVFAGNGNGTFQAPTSYAIGSGAFGTALADVNGDGKPDIIEANTNDYSVGVLLNTAAFPSISLSNGVLTANGTSEADTASVTLQSGNIVVTIDTTSKSYSASSVSLISMSLGAGNDSLSIGEGVGKVSVNANGGRDTIVASNNAADTLVGGAGADFVQGGGHRESLNGGAGPDTIVAGSGHDTIEGGAGNDSITGGAKASVIDGGDDNDTIQAGNSNDTITGGTGSDSIHGGLGSSVLDGSEGSGDTIHAGTANDTITGSAEDDSLTGGPGAVLIKGGQGDDTIVSGTGNNTLRGNAGNDSLDGDGGGNDKLTAGPGNDTMAGATSGGQDTLTGGAGMDSIAGGDTDSIIPGSGLNSTVTGGSDPLVTYILSINDNGSGVFTPGEYAVYAIDNDSNGGIAGFGVGLGGGVGTLTNVSPEGEFDDGLGDGFTDPAGFTLGRTTSGPNNPNTTNPIGAAQEVVNITASPAIVLVYGFGQSGGNLHTTPNAPPNNTGLHGVVQQIYQAQLLVGVGTFSGSIAFGTGNNTADVFPTTSSTNTEPAGVVLQTQTLS